MRTFISILLSASLILTPYHINNCQHILSTLPDTFTSVSANISTENSSINIAAPSAILLEASTGSVIYEKTSHQKLRPASITKIMTLILIFDALSDGRISLNDEVTTSEHASEMGGSQVFLETYETQTVETLIKCICVASANDACVAMAEYICGTEHDFVDAMNKRANSLGMTDTHFENCCGLDTDDHTTTAYDVALMSRELITKYPQIYNYTQIWMEDITHNTKRGSRPFTLANTNKLLRQYPYATGLKTGSTSLAHFCLSATASKDNIDLIAVVMAAPTPKDRFADARTLLDYGFNHCQLYVDQTPPKLPEICVKKGKTNTVHLAYSHNFSYVDTVGSDLSLISTRIVLPEYINAPVHKGDHIGDIVYSLNNQELGNVPILSTDNIAPASLVDIYLNLLSTFV